MTTKRYILIPFLFHLHDDNLRFFSCWSLIKMCDWDKLIFARQSDTKSVQFIFCFVCLQIIHSSFVVLIHRLTQKGLVFVFNEFEQWNDDKILDKLYYSRNGIWCCHHNRLESLIPIVSYSLLIANCLQFIIICVFYRIKLVSLYIWFEIRCTDYWETPRYFYIFISLHICSDE